MAEVGHLQIQRHGTRAEDSVVLLVDGKVIWQGTLAEWSLALARVDRDWETTQTVS